MKKLRSYDNLFERYSQPEAAAVLRGRDLDFDIDNGLSAQNKDFSYIWHDAEVVLIFYGTGGKFYVDFIDGRRFNLKSLKSRQKDYDSEDYRFVHVYDTAEAALEFLRTAEIDTSGVDI